MTAIATQAIGYIRRSTDRQEESLDQQRAKLEAFAKVKGWSLVHVYVDDAISGSDMDRPGLLQLVERVEKDSDVAAVIAWDRNRLARPKDAIDGLMLERRIMAAGKRIVYAATNREADRSFAGGLLGYVEHHQNGDYLRKLSRDVTRGMRACVERGRWPGGVAPFGYDKLIVDHAGNPRRILRSVEGGAMAVLDPTDGRELERIPNGQRYRKQDHEEVTLIPSDAARVRAVQRVFSDYAAGVPTRRIRDDLNAAGFRTSTGGVFSVPALQVILDNPAYTGRCVYNRRTESKWHRLVEGTSTERQDEGTERRPESDWIVTENAWPAIIDDATFAAVKAKRAQNRERVQPLSGSSVHAGYLLTGLAFCSVCGSKLVGQTSTAGSKGRNRYRYYICGGHHKGDKVACPTRYTVPAEAVEDYILGLIRCDLGKLRDDADLQALIVREFERLTAGQTDARGQLQRRLAELDQQTAKLRDHLTALDVETAKAMGLYDQAKTVAQERAQVERDMATAGPALPAIPGADEVRAMAGALFDKFDVVMAGGTLEERRAFIAAYVQRVEADPSRQKVTIKLLSPLFTTVSGDFGACKWHPTSKSPTTWAPANLRRRVGVAKQDPRKAHDSKPMDAAPRYSFDGTVSVASLLCKSKTSLHCPHESGRPAEGQRNPTMMTAYEKWHFDLMGYVVLPRAVPPADIARMRELGLAWAQKPDDQLPRPLATYGKPAFDPAKVRALNYVEYADAVFQRALINKEIMRIILTLTDNCPQVLLSGLQVYPAGSGPGPMHNGSAGGIHNPANYYQAAGDRVFATFLNVGICVTDSLRGEGFVCVPGSHKSNFACPAEITVDSPAPLVIAPDLHAGDVVIFTELLRHGGRNWNYQPEPRIVLYTRYGTSYASWSVGYRAMPEYAHLLTPELVELMEPMGFQGRKKMVTRLLKELGEG